MKIENEADTSAISFRLKPEQRAAVEAAAAREGLALASYARRVVLLHIAEGIKESADAA